ncbi:MAG: ABC transporter ATP-binding protein [Propionibacteriales bacterium]|nr:ABC transporter ATP-binding protein [Propionibacteriales bacterium]
MAAIELKNIVKTFADGTSALDGISLEVADGEFMILVGPSGCGKSTLLRVVAGLEDITSGDLLIDGEVANGRSPNERNLAMVFQTYALYPHLSVYENIAFPLRLTKQFNRREIDTLVREASHTLDLDDVLQNKPNVLSGGQRQRVAMGRAMVRDARALLLDEPLSNLDAQMRGQMRAEIAWLQKRLGVTTLYVTHDQAEAMSLGDRVAVLERGTVQQVATPQHLYRHPANMFVAGFIGSPPMSFLPATVRGNVVELAFAWVKISDAKAARAYGREQLIVGIRPERVELKDLVGTDHQYARIPVDVPPDVPEHLMEYEKELAGGWLHSPFDLRAEFTGRFLEHGRGEELYLNAESLHLFDPASGYNLTQGVD